MNSASVRHLPMGPDAGHTALYGVYGVQPMRQVSFLGLARCALTAVFVLSASLLTASPALTGQTSVWITPKPPPAQGETQTIPFFPSAGNAHGWQAFMRVANRSDVGGDAMIRVIDDSGRDFGIVTLGLAAGETAEINSSDLEDGNPGKGLAGRVGARGQGHLRLEVTSDLRIEALAYIRTPGGFVTPMHGVAPAAEARANAYRIVTFNPGSSYRQESMLRLVNPGDAEASVSIRGVDDRGRQAGPVRFTVAAGASRTVSALELEEGASDLDGALGDGSGKWRLDVESSAPLLAMSLLATPAGLVTNLSTATSFEQATSTDGARRAASPFVERQRPEGTSGGETHVGP